MSTVGLRELRQNASELLRQVESGEEVTITVAGRASARLVPVDDRSWRRWDQVKALFDGPDDPAWPVDGADIDQPVADPWERG